MNKSSADLPLNKQVEKLCKVTTQLTGEVVGQKDRLTAMANAASVNAGKAQGEADKASSHRVGATNAELKAHEHKNNAEAAANKAVQISGLSTVTEAVKAALDGSNLQALSMASREQMRAIRRKNGSGFKHWGKHIDNGVSGVAVNEGLWALNNSSNNLRLGRIADPNSGTSSKDTPVVVMGGVEFNVEYLNTGIDEQTNLLSFPDAPDGTKAIVNGKVFDYLNEVDPKYGDKALSHNEAVCRAFEGLIKNGDSRYGLNHWTSYGNITARTENGSFFLSSPDSTSRLEQFSSIAKGKAGYEFTVTLINPVSSLGNASISIGGQDYGRIPNDGIAHTVKMTTIESNDGWMRIYPFGAGEGNEIEVIECSVRHSDDYVITTRQDLAFFESWVEKVSDKGVLFDNGLVQYGKSGSGLTETTAAGIAQGYTAFGKWDESTTGYCRVLSSMSFVELMTFINKAENNCFYDGSELMQDRLRAKSIEGINDSWSNARAYKEDTKSHKNSISAITGWDGLGVRPQGGFVTSTGLAHPSDPSGDIPHGGFSIGSSVDGSDYPNDGCYYSRNARTGKESDGGYIAFLPICLAQRVNQGAHDPRVNYFGTRTINSQGGEWANSEWTMYDHKLTKKECFLVASGNPAENENYGSYVNSGSIKFTRSGSSTQYKYHDEIKAGQVKDLRLPTKDNETTLEQDIHNTVSGKSRGWGKVPFCKFRDDMGSGSHPDKTKKWQMSGGDLWMYLDNFDGLDEGDALYLVDNTKGFIAKCTVLDGQDARIIGRNPEFIKGSAVSGEHGELSTDIYVITHKMMSPCFDELPYCNLIGLVENLKGIFSDGCAGEWIHTQPELQSKDFEHTRKANKSTGNRAYRKANSDDGWLSSGYSISEQSNTMNGFSDPDWVSVLYYPSLSNCSESSPNQLNVSGVNQVCFMADYRDIRGGRLAYSLIGKVIKNGGSGRRYGYSGVEQYSLGGGGELIPDYGYFPVHAKFDLSAPTNDSQAAKAAYCHVVIDGLKYLQYNGCELKSSESAISPIFVTTSDAYQYEKGKVYCLSNSAFGALNGSYWQFKINTKNTAAQIASSLASIIHKPSGDSSIARVWNGSVWGDDNRVPIISGEGTKEDLGGEIVKTFCHRSLMPVGLA